MGDYDNRCRDTRECCFRDENGRCKVLVDAYRYDRDCNFAKKHPTDKYSYNHLQRIRGKR